MLNPAELQLRCQAVSRMFDADLRHFLLQPSILSEHCQIPFNQPPLIVINEARYIDAHTAFTRQAIRQSANAAGHP
jgi:hypothetical protein